MDVEKDLEGEETQLRRLNIHFKSKKEQLEKWVSTAQFIVKGDVSSSNIVVKLNDILPKMERLAIE